jgi:hypothetical protein
MKIPRLLNPHTIADLVVVAALMPVLLYIGIFFRLDSASGVLLYYGVPSLYLCLRRKKNYRKVFIASAVLGILFGMAYDMGVELQNIWIINYHNPILAYHIVGKTPLGDFLWAFFVPLYPIIFYEHFFDGERVRRLSGYAKDAFLFGLFLFVAGWALLIFYPSFPQIPYAYAVLGFAMAAPIFAFFTLPPTLFKKIIAASVFFAVFNLLGEIVWLAIEQGTYPGQYFTTVPVLGVWIPIEELVYWILASTPSLLFCYELLFDDFR